MIKSVLASVAAAGLTFAPIVAQAGTRASTSNIELSADVGDASRLASPVIGAQALEEDGELLLYLLIAVAGALVINEIVTSKGIIH